MAESGWIFVSTAETVEYQELTDGTLQKRDVQTYVRRKLYTQGSPTSLNLSGGSTSSSLSSSSGQDTITSTGSYTCDSDQFNLQGRDPVDMKERVQSWIDYGTWGTA